MKTMVLPLHSVCLRVADERLRRDFGQQIVERLAVVRLVEEIDERLGDDRADALHRRQLGLAALATVATRRSSSIVPKHLSRSLAVTMPTWRMPRPNRKRGPSGWRLASIAASRLSTDFSFQPSRPSSSSRCSRRRKMSAGECSQPSSMNSAIALLAQPFDVERAARDEMPQPLEPLRRADQAAGAADVDLAFLGDRLGCAFGAMVGEDVRLARLVAGQVLDHLRDDVAGALDAHAVADAQAEPRDLVAVVERDVGDDHAADADRLQPPDRRQLAGAADLDVDRFERGLGFLGGEFVREAPARRAARLKPSRSCQSSRSTL